jgi:hypothetical protein
MCVKNDLTILKYETYRVTFYLMKGFTGKTERYHDRKCCGMLPVHKTVEVPVTSSRLLVAYLELNTDCI